MTFFVQVWLWEVLWSFFSVQPLRVVAYHRIKSLFIACHNLIKKWFPAVVQNKTRRHFKTTFFFFFTFGHLTRHPLIELFHLSNLLQMPNNHRMVNVELFSNFSCCCKRISFNEPLSLLLSTSDDQPWYSLSSRVSSPLQNLLNHQRTECLLAVPGPNALLMLQVISATLRSILNLNKKITQICFCPTSFL